MSVSNYDYPEDEFDVGDDDGPVPVGVHRAQVPRWRSWAPLLAIIISGGSKSSDAVSSSSSQPAQSGQAGGNKNAENNAGAASAKPSASASPSGNVDFTTRVTVANGTNTDGLAKGASEKLTNGGFTAVEVIPGIYENAEPAQSTVYFSSPQARPAAEEVGKRLGITNVVEGTAENTQGATIAVILRDDYKPQ